MGGPFVLLGLGLGKSWVLFLVLSEVNRRQTSPKVSLAPDAPTAYEKAEKSPVWNPKSSLLLVCHSLMAMLAFCVVAIMSSVLIPPWIIFPLNERRLTIRPKIPFAPIVSQQYGYVSLLCGRSCVVSITSYVDYFTRVKSSETNDMTLPCTANEMCVRAVVSFFVY